MTSGRWVCRIGAWRMEPIIRAKRWAAQTAQASILSAFRAGDYNPRLEAARAAPEPAPQPRKREKPRQRQRSCRECRKPQCLRCKHQPKTQAG